MSGGTGRDSLSLLMKSILLLLRFDARMDASMSMGVALGSALTETKMSLVMGSSRLRSDRIVGTFFGGGWVGFGCVLRLCLSPIVFLLLVDDPVLGPFRLLMR